MSKLIYEQLKVMKVVKKDKRPLINIKNPQKARERAQPQKPSGTANTGT